VRIGIVAGEASGDILGAGLIRALREYFPDAVFDGVGGPLMLEQGFQSMVPMERLSVMGLIEPLKRLPELLSLRKRLIRSWLANPPDVFIGIDSPDFNLGIEKALRAGGIKTVHYVSPSVWAWRRRRINKIKKSVDLMLTLFPFEAAFYREQGVPVVFVGHPLADQLPLQPDRHAARENLGLDAEAPVLAVLPGSRGGEVRLLGEVFMRAALELTRQRPGLQCLVVAANEARLAELQAIRATLGEADDACLRIQLADSHAAMAAADVVMLASGTATLEAMLLKRPMVVAYKMAPLSHAIISRMLKVPYIALPNLLADKKLVPEFIQDEVDENTLAAAVLEQLDNAQYRERLNQAFLAIHQDLRRDASAGAASAIAELLGGDQPG
jgi:lipid-A-disaccharide synthase